MAELVRAIRDRLSDTQINLKPLAARVIGKMLSHMEKGAQAKFGQLLYAPLVSGVMNDIKKPMRDACLESLKAGTSLPAIDGGGLNEESLENLINGVVAEVTETSIKVCKEKSRKERYDNRTESHRVF